MNLRSFYSYFASLLWDAWCLLSIVGIWPRFIEPRLIKTRILNIPIKNLPDDLQNLKILQFSDLHIHINTPKKFLDKLSKKILAAEPDLILFTGDFLCHAKMEGTELLLPFLTGLKARYGCYAICGNHDYHEYLSVNKQGEYDLSGRSSTTIIDGLQHFFWRPRVTGKCTESAKQLVLNHSLCKLLAQTPIQLLHNESVKLSIKNSFINICGMGEYMAGRCLPDQAYKNYDNNFPGIILSHNPDSVKLLKTFPGDLILCGHTHGGQINLPWFKSRTIISEDPSLRHGLFQVGSKTLYINRGVGSTFPFRWFAMPELLVAILKKDEE